jgi:hypothetical protein
MSGAEEISEFGVSRIERIEELLLVPDPDNGRGTHAESTAGVYR